MTLILIIIGEFIVNDIAILFVNTMGKCYAVKIME